MSRPNRTTGSNIKGPQSALTDFLASHNINATQIRHSAEARRRALVQNGEEGDNVAGATAADAAGDAATSSPDVAAELVDRPAGRRTRSSLRVTETTEEKENRKKEEQKTVAKIKANKKLNQKKRKGGPIDDDDTQDELARVLNNEPPPPLPGQMDNCVECGKRFTVTPYSRSGPTGGLLCSPCGKAMDKEQEPLKKKAKRSAGGQTARRRQVQSRILDGSYQTGAKGLVTLCVETLAKNIDLAEDLLGLPPAIIDKIARKLSKHRLVDPQTVTLFMQPSAEDISIYDGSKLGSDDYIRIFQTVPGLKNLKIRNAIQFKDEVMDFLLSRNIELSGLYLWGANLVSEDKWHEFLRMKGTHLKSLQVQYTDRHFGDASMALLEECCPSLRRLKVCHNQSVGPEGVRSIAQVKSLEHLSLDLHKMVHPDIFVTVLDQIGRNLRTFSLTQVLDLDNSVLDALHRNCRALSKLRITSSEVVSDAGFVRLFTNWQNPPLRYIDFEKCRQVDPTHPRQNPDNIGLCSDGFRALMKHSGRKVQHLNLHACRHISAKAFEDVFAPDMQYPELRKFEISFCEQVTDLIVGNIFRSCPKLYELNVFGCMKVKDVRVPSGKILVGVPNAMGMVIAGDDD